MSVKIDHFEKHHREAMTDSALNVAQGVDDQPIVNPNFVRRRRPQLTTEQFVAGILARDISVLSQAITLVESNNPAHYQQAQQIIEQCLPHAGRSIRIGITGVPGAGKSTFIEAVGSMIVNQRDSLLSGLLGSAAKGAAVNALQSGKSTDVQDVGGGDAAQNATESTTEAAARAAQCAARNAARRQGYTAEMAAVTATPAAPAASTASATAAMPVKSVASADPAASGTHATSMVQKSEYHRLAVLAIDPSSERSGGSILGDKTRMETISADPRIFIRPSPSAGSLGGVARKTRETVVLCEAAGYDVILIETVGVGQSETAVHSMVDMFMLLQIAGAGDELQGIKRGIMEMADMIVITKADGDNITRAGLAKRQFENALMLFPTPENGWKPQVYTSSSVSGNGLPEVWSGVGEFLAFVRANGFWAANRNRQNQYWMRETIEEALRNDFYQNPEIESLLPRYREMVAADRMSSFVAAHELLDRYYKKG